MKEQTVLIGSTSYLIRQGFMQLLKSVNVKLEIYEAESEKQFAELMNEYNPTIVLIDPMIIGDLNHFLTSNSKSKVVAGICRNSDSKDKSKFKHCLFIYESKKSLINKLQKLIELKDDFVDTQSSELSDREIAILKKVALGFTNKEISDQLFISPHTVITHRKNITAKLGIKTISGLTVYALINNLINAEDINIG